MGRKKSSVRFIFSVLFIVLIITTFGIIGYFVFSNWKTSADNIVAKIEMDTKDDILGQMENFINVPLNINEVNHYLIQNEIVKLDKNEQWQMFFAGVMKSNSVEVYSFSYGNEKGEYYGSRRNAKNEIELIKNNEMTGGSSWYYSTTKDLLAGELVEKTGKFDVRTRDWYKIAKEQQKPTFSPIYKHFIVDDLAISASYPVYNNGVFEGVLGTHIILSKINKYLKEITEDKKAEAYIIEKNSRELVANSVESPNFQTLTNNEIKRTKIEEINNKWIIDAYRDYIKGSKDSFVVKTENDKLHIRLTEYKKEGLDWLIITAIPENKYTADIIKSIRISIGLSIIAVIIAILIYIKSTAVILKPIYNLIDTTERFAKGDFQERAEIIRDDEVGELSQAFNNMAEQLYTLINTLEDKVKERTIELEKTNIALKENEGNILYLSYRDQLTGLYNRRYFEEELRKLDKPESLPLAIVMADMNGLKLINDSLGHLMGDEFLKKTAEVIRKGCRTGDVVARLAGDEFVILLPKTDTFAAEQVIKRIKDIASKEKVGSVDISISFGYDTKVDNGEKIEDVFKKAEDNMYKKKLFESPSMRGKTINTIISTLHEKNKLEEAHARRVSELCKSMGKALRLPEGDIAELKTVGLLHDIGKIALNENIISKSGKLTEEEWEEIKRHPEIGYRILSTVNDMAEMAEYVLAHHERWDGKGYPKGLKETEIPLQSRIIAIADAYDAMTSERRYRGALTEEMVIEELKKNAGIQFDPELVSVFIEKVVGRG